uniref:Uncharacterized protein n=1 Tax=Romanomermis culicivorax TaxID=13658 RepID=A0A915JMN3_ROMCU
MVEISMGDAVKDKGSPNKTSLNSYGIIGQKTSSVPGYDYTDANKSKSIMQTKENLFVYLENPKKLISGTKMILAGLNKESEQVYLIALLETARSA